MLALAFNCKHWTSLLLKFVNYGRKKFKTLAPERRKMFFKAPTRCRSDVGRRDVSRVAARIGCEEMRKWRIENQPVGAESLFPHKGNCFPSLLTVNYSIKLTAPPLPVKKAIRRKTFLPRTQ